MRVVSGERLVIAQLRCLGALRDHGLRALHQTGGGQFGCMCWGRNLARAPVRLPRPARATRGACLAHARAQFAFAQIVDAVVLGSIGKPSTTDAFSTK